MAETYEQYQKNQAARERGNPANRWMSIEDRMDVAMNQTELLQNVRRRVQAFVDAYEKLNSSYMDSANEIRSRPNLTDRMKSVADNIERDYQHIYSQGHAGDKDYTAITLDDLKVLLDQFPQSAW